MGVEELDTAKKPAGRGLQLVRGEQAEIRGTVTNLPVTSLLQLLDMEGSSSALRIESADRVGHLDCAQGRVLRAVTDGGLEGLEAASEILRWSRARIDWSPLETRGEWNLDLPIQHLLLDLTRLQDEADRDTPRTPETSSGTWDVFDGAVLPFAPRRNSSAVAFDLLETADVATALTHVMTLRGALGACLVDITTGEMVGSLGDDRFDLGLAATVNTQVVLAKRQAIEALDLDDEIQDILIRLGKQFHLIRPLTNQPNFFFYLVLRADRANLAMARHRLAEVEQRLRVA